MKKIVLFVLTLICLFGCKEESKLDEYIPIIYIKGKGLVNAPQLLTEEHLNNLEYVLNIYKIKFKRVTVSKLLIESTVDRETQWNYTTKANDKKWLKNFQGETVNY